MYIDELLIRKKDGTLQEYCAEKIVNAINKSADRCSNPLNDNEVAMVISTIEKELMRKSSNVIAVSYMHTLVINTLEKIRPDVANSYRNYRYFKENRQKIMWSQVTKKSNNLRFMGDRSNSNADSKLASTISCIINSYVTEAQYYEYFLTVEELQAVRDGYIYTHDASKRLDYPFNCDLFDIKTVLSGGFMMSNIWYNEPKSLDVAFDVIGDIVLSAASQQYGGFTIPEVDSILEKYAELSYQSYYEKYIELGIDEDKAKMVAEKDVMRDFEQGFQGWEYKFNTVASSRGDYPFIATTFGINNSKWGKMASACILNVRRKGQGKKGNKRPVLFPKLIFLYDENLHGAGMPMEDIFELGLDCSMKAMYPDWLSLTGTGYVPSMYKKYCKVISPMGCRAFLSPWYLRGGMDPADENDEPIFIGRFNIGVISLHLPMIYAKAKKEHKEFYEVLDFYLEMVRNIHKRTYEYIGEIPASRNPLAFCEGGLYGGHLGYDEKIKPLLKSATASFGITAMNELQQLHNKKSLVSDGMFALEVADYINKKIDEYKKEDSHLYAIYATPAESLCGKQVEQFRSIYGVVEGVSDRSYVSNGFHCHVTEDIKPTEKQNLEHRFWDYFNGGKIQYVKYALNYNKDAARTLIRRAMEMGFYEGVNLSLSYCDDCGYEELHITGDCPKCGSSNITNIDRMNGYLSYSRLNGNDTRLNQSKMDEIKERVSM